MSTDNPYFAEAGGAPLIAPPATPPSGAQPRNLMTVCVLLIVLGLFGAMGSFLTIVGQLVAPALQSLAETRKPGQTQAQHEAEVQMQRETAAATQPWRPVVFGLQGIHLILSVGMVLGAIFCIRRKGLGPDLLSYSCMAAVGYEIFNLVIQILVSLETFPISSRFMKKSMENAPGNVPPNMGALMGSVMQGAMWVTIAFLVAWTAAKVIAEVIGFRYMKKPEVLEYIRAKHE